jgi:hypothetical protein
MINQAPIVRYMASVCEIFFADFCKKTFSAESHIMSDPWVDDPERGGEINPFIPDDLQFKVLVVLL